MDISRAVSGCFFLDQFLIGFRVLKISITGYLPCWTWIESGRSLWQCRGRKAHGRKEGARYDKEEVGSLHEIGKVLAWRRCDQELVSAISESSEIQTLGFFKYNIQRKLFFCDQMEKILTINLSWFELKLFEKIVFVLFHKKWIYQSNITNFVFTKNSKKNVKKNCISLYFYFLLELGAAGQNFNS